MELFSLIICFYKMYKNTIRTKYTCKTITKLDAITICITWYKHVVYFKDCVCGSTMFDCLF